jgi:hypothetical protein
MKTWKKGEPVTKDTGKFSDGITFVRSNVANRDNKAAGAGFNQKQFETVDLGPVSVDERDKKSASYAGDKFDSFIEGPEKDLMVKYADPAAYMRDSYHAPHEDAAKLSAWLMVMLAGNEGAHTLSSVNVEDHQVEIVFDEGENETIMTISSNKLVRE